MKTIFGVVALLFASTCAQAQVPVDPNAQTPWETTTTAGVPSMAILPNVSTRAIAPANGSYVRLYFVNLVNTTASSVTVTVTDGSTNCNGGACNLLPSTTALTIAAGTIYTIKLDGVPSVGGVYWSASTANAVHGWMKGTR